jgi:hypothetical protein
MESTRSPSSCQWFMSPRSCKCNRPQANSGNFLALASFWWWCRLFVGNLSIPGNYVVWQHGNLIDISTHMGCRCCQLESGDTHWAIPLRSLMYIHYHLSGKSSFESLEDTLTCLLMKPGLLSPTSIMVLMSTKSPVLHGWSLITSKFKTILSCRFTGLIMVCNWWQEVTVEQFAYGMWRMMPSFHPCCMVSRITIVG